LSKRATDLILDEMKDRWTGLKPGERPFREAALFYGEYRYRPSKEFARLLATHLGWSPDDRLLDLGAGPAHVSTLFAPYVREVVVMEPEEAMLDEGRKRAASAGVENLSFVRGGSDDLQRLRTSLGEFVAVVMSQSFHWMHDQDSVLLSLNEMLDTRRGAVALIGYVNEPDYNRVWVGLDREPWSKAETILRRHLNGVPEGPSPRGRHDPFPDVLERSSFSRVELLSYEHEVEVRPSIDAAIGALYTLGNTVDGLGESRAAFEAEVREALGDAATTPFHARLVDSALIGRMPASSEVGKGQRKV
jgi:SAM-dependent methyltransferase